jgi:hypothetical protein
MAFEVTWGDEGSGYAAFKTSGTGRLSIFSRGELAKIVGTADLPSQAKAQDHFVMVLRSRNVDKRLKRMKGKCTGPIIGPEDYPDWGIRAVHPRPRWQPHRDPQLFRKRNDQGTSTGFPKYSKG